MFRKTKTQKRQALRKKIRRYKDKSQRGVLSKRGFFKWKKLENRYQQLGIDIMLAAPFYGLDLTGAKLLNDAGEQIYGKEFSSIVAGNISGPDSPEWMLKADTQWGSDGPQPMPKGVEVEYRLVDGQVQTYENGKVVDQQPMIDHPMWWRQEQRTACQNDGSND